MDTDSGAKRTSAPANPGHQTVTFRRGVAAHDSSHCIRVHLCPSVVSMELIRLSPSRVVSPSGLFGNLPRPTGLTTPSHPTTAGRSRSCFGLVLLPPCLPYERSDARSLRQGTSAHRMNAWRFKLLYDGECPFCLREVRWLRRRDRHGRLAFEDVTSPDFDPARYRTTRRELLGVIHGVFPDGRIVRKVEVLRQAYRAVGLGWWLAPTGWPLLRWVSDGLYAIFARYRVPIGRVLGRSCASDRCQVRDEKRDDPGGH